MYILEEAAAREGRGESVLLKVRVVERKRAHSGVVMRMISRK